MRPAVLFTMCVVATVGGQFLQADVTEVTEDQKYTTPFAGEELGTHVDAFGQRCAAETPSGNVRHLWWRPVIGWSGSSAASTSQHSLDADHAGMVISTTNVATMEWPDGEPFPPGLETRYIQIDDATAVALDGNRIAVSRWGAGLVSTFTRVGTGEWTLEHQFSGSVAINFGAAIDLYADTLVIGIPRDAGGAAGSVQVWYNLDNPSPSVQTLPSPGGEAGNTFGASVAVWGDWLAVGAPLEDTAFPQPVGTDVGATYVYKREPTLFEHRATLYGEGNGDHSGASVDLKGITLVVGAPLHDVVSTFTIPEVGAVDVHRRQGDLWGTVYRLKASDSAAYDRLGASVAIATPGILVGAPGARGTSGEADAGGVYCYNGIANGIFADTFEHGTTQAWSLVVQ